MLSRQATFVWQYDARKDPRSYPESGKHPNLNTWDGYPRSPRNNEPFSYTLGKKGCYTPIEDNKTNVDRTFVFPLGWNWHDMDPWLFPNEIRHYLGQTFNARSSEIVELRNHSIGGRSPKSIFTLWQLWINICIFFSKVFLIVRTMPRPTPMSIRHEVFALAREGIMQGAIAARVGLTRATVNRILKRHAATGSLVPGKSSEAPRKTTPRQDRAFLRMVRQDRFLSAREWVRNEGWSHNG